MRGGLCLGVIPAAARADWTTYRADRALSGVDQSGGAAVPFAAAWNRPGLTGTVWAEPLVFAGLVIVATENNDLYAFHEATGPGDANGPPIIAGALVWVAATQSARLYGLDPLTGAVRVTQSTPAMEHFVTRAASDGRLFLATGPTLNAVACRAAVRLTLRVPRHERIITVTVYAGHRRLLIRRGHRLRRVSVAHLGTGSYSVCVLETPRYGRRFYAHRPDAPLSPRPGAPPAVIASEPDIPSLDHVQLAAPPGCEPAARRFYGELLGLAELAKPEPLRARGGVWFALRTGQLHIGVEDPFLPAGKAHPALRYRDAGALEALAARLQTAGATVRWDAERADVHRFYTEDPWGNRLELLAAR